jgi:hypothetical protein
METFDLSGGPKKGIKRQVKMVVKKVRKGFRRK